MYATGKFTFNPPSVGELKPVMSDVSVQPQNGGHAIALRIFDGPTPKGKTMTVRLSPREARAMASELLAAATILQGAREATLSAIDRAHAAAVHYMDKSDDPGHGEGSMCETCLYHLTNG